jgi:hypothetical protein
MWDLAAILDDLGSAAALQLAARLVQEGIDYRDQSNRAMPGFTAYGPLAEKLASDRLLDLRAVVSTMTGDDALALARTTLEELGRRS